MLLRRLVEMLQDLRGSAPNERSIKAVQTEALRSETGAVLDRVDDLVPPKHDRFARYGRMRAEAIQASSRFQK